MALSTEQLAILAGELEKLKYRPLIAEQRVNDLYFILNAPQVVRSPGEDDALLPTLGQILPLITTAEKSAMLVSKWADLAVATYDAVPDEQDMINGFLAQLGESGSMTYDVANMIIREKRDDLVRPYIRILIAGGIMSTATALGIQAAIANRAKTMYSWGESIVGLLGLPAVTAEDITAALGG